MFSSQDCRFDASNAAQLHVRLESACVALRIRLQRLVDVGNQLPIEDLDTATQTLESDSLKNVLRTLNESLSSQLNEQAEMNECGDLNSDQITQLWRQTVQPQKLLKRKWEDVIEKFYSRSHFRSGSQSMNLKSFRTSFWEQIDVALSDRQRCIEKSRFPIEETPRLDVNHDLTGSVDEEVYDDRHFYSVLVKSFASSFSGSLDNSSGIRSEDIKALQRLRKKRQNVDRKASKGRKIRYVVHDKLQNFMFPVQSSAPPMNVDKLYQSLFQ